MSHEAQVWTYAMSLPKSIVANYDTDIEDQLANVNDELMVTLLGTKISEEKIVRVCGRIARNILVPGIEDLDEEADEYYPAPLEPREMLTFLNETCMKASTLLDIYKGCKGFKRAHPDARTWNEIRAVADPYTLKGDSLKDFLRDWQREQTEMYLGLPKQIEWSNRMRDKTMAQLEAKVPSLITDIQTWRDSDLIIVVPQRENKGGAMAVMVTPKNVMKLYPCFFGDDKFMSLRDIPIHDGMKFEDMFPCCTRYFLHEITHAKGVLETKDHISHYVPGEYDVLEKWQLHPVTKHTSTTRPCRRFRSYGLEACLALARRDKMHNMTKSEDNADSWSFYIMLRMIILAYPDMDILEAIRTEDVFASRTRRVRQRSRLLHHCTLFQPLRHKEAGRIQDHPDYDQSKDYFADPGEKIPETIEETLDYLKLFDNVFYAP